MITDDVRIYLRVYDGTNFNLVDVNHLRPEQIDIYGAAHVLSQICRYGGNLETSYSVAQHSVLVSQLLEKIYPPAAMWGLLHDIGESLGLGDLPTPIKKLLPDYIELEKRVLRVVADRFKLPWPWPKSVDLANQSVLYREQACLQNVPEFYFPASQLVAPRITPVSALEAEIMFLRQYLHLKRD